LQNPDSTWSHKKGGNEVGILDSDHNIIFNPENSKRDFGISELSEFLGYYAISEKPNIPNFKEFLREKYFTSQAMILKERFSHSED
jgi:hypothetical protein